MQFSIIIPAKNELSNFKRILPSYKKLRGIFDFELIVADGKSDDGTIEYAENYADKVEVKTKKERETIGEGRNRGAAVASGDVFIFLDAGVIVDDMENFFHTVLAAFDDPNVIAATTNVRIDPKVALWQDKVVHEMINGIVHLWNVFGWGAGKGEVQLIRASAFKESGGYNEKLVAAEDNELYRRLAKKGKIVFLKELQVFDDPRRYRKEGYARVVGKWMLNQMSVMLTGHSYSKEWKRVG